MGRRQQPEIKQGLLEVCTDYALAHGLPERLEPLAQAAHTSARMLLYHFGSRDELLREILRRARQRQVDMFGDLLRARPGERYTITLDRAWAEMTGAEGRPLLQMFGQLRESTEQQLWPGFRRLATTDWIPPIQDGLRSIGKPELATLVLAVIRGLLMDLDATADAHRTGQAFQSFLHLLDAEVDERGPETARSLDRARHVPT